MPLLTEADLAVAGRGLPAGTRGWPVFEPPTVSQAGGETLAVMGYRLPLPDGFTVGRLRRVDDGVEAYIRASTGTGQSASMRLSVQPLVRRADGTPVVPTWQEALAAAGVTDASEDIQHGTIGQLPFVRAASRAVRTGAETGRVAYVGLPGADLPVTIVLTFQTHPFRNDLALACEAVARSFSRTDPVMADPFDPAVDEVATPMPEVTPVGSVSNTAQIGGMLAFPHEDLLRVRETSRGEVLQVNIDTHPRRHGGVEMVFTPMDVPARGPWPIQLEGPMRDWLPGLQRRFDSVVYAYGGEVGYVRLWDDALFVRVDHGIYSFDSSNKQHGVSYYGYLGGYRVEVRIVNDVDGRVPLSEIERYLHAARLATGGEMLAQGRRPWLLAALGPDAIDFPLAGGLRGADVLAVDSTGRGITHSSRYDPELDQLVREHDVYPPMEPGDLERFDQWEARRGADRHLGRVFEMGAFRMSTVRDLGRAVHLSETRAEWAAQTSAGELGIEVRLEALRDDDLDRLTPLVAGGRPGRTEIRLGRRTLRPTEPPEVTYRETGGLRIWRIKMQPVRGSDAGRCYYAAVVPGHMLVITATYALSSPEQLDAFDAAVQTLDYRPLAP